MRWIAILVLSISSLAGQNKPDMLTKLEVAVLDGVVTIDGKALHPCVMGSACSCTTSEDPKIGLDVKFKQSPDTGTELIIRLRNESAESLPVYNDDLPWVRMRSMTLIAVETSDFAGIVLGGPQFKPNEDSAEPWVTIKPGESLTGEISLITRFPRIEESLKDRDVILFWSYRLRIKDGRRSNRVTGWVLVPQRPPQGNR